MDDQDTARVALLAEGVDRNTSYVGSEWGLRNVALLAEGVDRNWQVKAERTNNYSRPPRGGRG